MAIKTTLNYSPNFNLIKRNNKQIKFIIFHYTGMKRESAAINRLTSLQSEVSSHYLIKKNGEILTLVPDLYTAWHAGKSSWNSFNSLNRYSIGIEITNPGHDFKYQKFSNKQIKSILKISKFLIKKYKIDPKNILGHSDISPLRKKDPGEKFPWKYLSKNKIGIWHSLSNHSLKKNRKIKINSSSKEKFLKNIYQIGYSRKIPIYFNKKRYSMLVIKAFQRRFRQELINGIIDKECHLISENLIKKIS